MDCVVLADLRLKIKENKKIDITEPCPRRKKDVELEGDRNANYSWSAWNRPPKSWKVD